MIRTAVTSYKGLFRRVALIFIIFIVVSFTILVIKNSFSPLLFRKDKYVQALQSAVSEATIGQALHKELDTRGCKSGLELEPNTHGCYYQATLYISESSRIDVYRQNLLSKGWQDNAVVLLGEEPGQEFYKFINGGGVCASIEKSPQYNGSVKIYVQAYNCINYSTGNKGWDLYYPEYIPTRYSIKTSSAASRLPELSLFLSESLERTDTSTWLEIDEVKIPPNLSPDNCTFFGSSISPCTFLLVTPKGRRIYAGNNNTPDRQYHFFRLGGTGISLGQTQMKSGYNALTNQELVNLVDSMRPTNIEEVRQNFPLKTRP